uniref:Uncharacterized protein n=1 Tax=Timema poppense TaxID=170557 RepID=A0A7R9DAN6_TIMPO|nr:unnamed protein product [Timema poppensis]
MPKIRSVANPDRRENYSINDLMHPVPLNWRHSQPVVQTPRYYKPTTLKKRPSRLCLPVACKLDPLYRTSRVTPAAVAGKSRLGQHLYEVKEGLVKRSHSFRALL